MRVPPKNINDHDSSESTFSEVYFKQKMKTGVKPVVVKKPDTVVAEKKPAPVVAEKKPVVVVSDTLPTITTKPKTTTATTG